MFISILTLLLISTKVQSDSAVILPIVQVKIGDKRNEIRMDDFQRGACFAIDENEYLWLTDYKSRQIKAFNKEGEVVYIIIQNNISVSIDKIYVYSDYLITLTSNGVLSFYNKFNGKLLTQHKLKIERALFKNAYFYDKYIFLPQFGSPLPNENLFEFVIEIEKSTEQSISFNVRQIGCIINSYDSNKMNNNYFPVDSACYSLLKDLHDLDFKGQSKDCILIRREGKDDKSDCYYVLFKKNYIIKSIGNFSKSVTGLIDNTGWGEASVIVGKYLYFIGVKYRDMNHYHNPQKIIISKLNLSIIDKLPTVTIEEMLAK